MQARNVVYYYWHYCMPPMSHIPPTPIWLIAMFSLQLKRCVLLLQRWWPLHSSSPIQPLSGRTENTQVRLSSRLKSWHLEIGAPPPSPPDTGRMCCAPRYFWLRFIPISSHSRSDAFSCERVARDTLHSDAGNQMMLMKQRGLQRLGPRSGPP